MSRDWRLTERTRKLLMLELAVVLPATALMGFSIWNLKHVQGDRAIEAAMQRDFGDILHIAQKESWRKAYSLTLPIRKEFPDPDAGPQIKVKLDQILSEHPEYSFAALYDKKTNTLVTRGHDQGALAYDYTQDEMNMLASWLPAEATHMVSNVREMEKENELVAFYGKWTTHVNHHVYWNVAYFVPPSVPKDRVVLGLVAFDQDYLSGTFLPTMMKEVLASKNGLRSEANPPVMMIRPTMSETPWVASGTWDGGEPEAERDFQWFLQGLTMDIKWQGTTVAELVTKFLRYNYTVLAALSVLMIGGIWLTYRNVSREMNLARLKSDFVANVSHELRTPLALIRLYAETLELGRLSTGKHQEYFRIIREESERLSALINNILDFSRIEAGRREYEFKETNLAELVRSTLDSYRFQIEQNGFALEETISNDVPSVTVDREAMTRSLLNLLNNALKYSKDRKYIGVSLYCSNGSVNLEVQDHGIGIPKAEQGKIFEKFYRCGDPLVHDVKGSGLGLSLVRHVVRAHGGDVDVESIPQKGSKFTIRLPLNRLKLTD
jgi:signal transduction histidine kinase